MELFEQLAAAIRHENEQGELPDYLVAPLQQVANQAKRYQQQTDLVRRLIEQLSDLDPYSDCGCFGEGYTVSDLITTLNKLGITVDGGSPSSCSVS